MGRGQKLGSGQENLPTLPVPHSPKHPILRFSAGYHHLGRNIEVFLAGRDLALAEVSSARQG